MNRFYQADHAADFSPRAVVTVVALTVTARNTAGESPAGNAEEIAVP